MSWIFCQKPASPASSLWGQPATRSTLRRFRYKSSTRSLCPAAWSALCQRRTALFRSLPARKNRTVNAANAVPVTTAAPGIWNLSPPEDVPSPGELSPEELSPIPPPEPLLSAAGSRDGSGTFCPAPD